MKPLTFLCILAIITGSLPAAAQQRTYHFQSGHTRLTPTDSSNLSQLIDSLGIDNIKKILIEGHSDSRGTLKLNIHLSRKRALAVMRILSQHAIPTSIIQYKAWGPHYPLADNHTSEGRYTNRRATISITIASKSDTSSIDELYRQLATPLQSFCIDPSRDTVIRCAQGTIIDIKANSFPYIPGCNQHCITFSVREDYLNSDMILDRLTTTSNEQLLETQGMIYTQATDCNGNKLELIKGKELVILMPTDTVRRDASIYTGHRLPDSTMNWQPDSSADLTNVRLNDLLPCFRPINDRNTVIRTASCPLLFCKIRKFFHRSAGSRPLITNTSTDTTRTMTRINRCSRLFGLLQKYGVTNADDLVKAMYAPLLDSLKCTSLNQLADTLEKLEMKKIELAYMNKKVSFDDFQYYLFKNSQLGSVNIDCMARLPASQRVDIRVNVRPARNIDCKILLRNYRTLFALYPNNNMYICRDLPRDLAAFLILIKFENGQPALALKEITTSQATYDVEFRNLTVPQLREEIKKLDFITP